MKTAVICTDKANGVLFTVIQTTVSRPDEQNLLTKGVRDSS